jgi:peptide/nickel transport system substrate-binding protein
MDTDGLHDQNVPRLPDRSSSRRRFLKGFATLMAAGVIAPLAAACAQQTPSAPSKPAETKPAESKPAAGEPKKGGSLKIAILGEPPALDYMFTTATVTNNTMWHVHETLFGRDDKKKPFPQLLEKYEPSSDGKTATLRLRKNVPFHNDKEMTSADVLASLKRYGEMAPRGKLIFTDLESMEAPDTYTVVMKFKQPRSGILPVFLSRDALITTKEIAEKFPKEKFTEYVGTGPY